MGERDERTGAVAFLHRLFSVLATSGTCLWFKKWSEL